MARSMARSNRSAGVCGVAPRRRHPRAHRRRPEAPHPAEGDQLLFVFDRGTLTSAEVDALKLGADEIAEARYWPSDQLESLTPARLARRTSPWLHSPQVIRCMRSAVSLQPASLARAFHPI